MASIRFATDRDRDLDRLEGIENDADELFLERFRPEEWAGAATGQWRAAQRGFLLVAAEAEDGEAVGFAHVLAGASGAHLEQLAVLRVSGRRGHGAALVRAALEEAGRRGTRASPSGPSPTSPGTRRSTRDPGSCSPSPTPPPSAS